MVDLFGRAGDSLEFESQGGVMDLRCPGWRQEWRGCPVGVSQAWVYLDGINKKVADGQGT